MQKCCISLGISIITLNFILQTKVLKLQKNKNKHKGNKNIKYMLPLLQWLKLQIRNEKKLKPFLFINTKYSLAYIGFLLFKN